MLLVGFVLFNGNVYAARDNCYAGLIENSNNTVARGEIVEIETGLKTGRAGGVRFEVRFDYDNRFFELIGSGEGSIIPNDEWTSSPVAIESYGTSASAFYRLFGKDSYKPLTSNVFSTIRLRVKEDAPLESTRLEFFRNSNFAFNLLNSNNEAYHVDSEPCGSIQYVQINVKEKEEPVPEPEAPKSSDASLKQVIISSSNYSKILRNDNLSQELDFSYDIDSVDIYAECNDKNCSISGDGKKNLNVGKNTFKLVLTAEDGTNQEYIITINRLEKVKASAKLKFLGVQNYSMTPNFKSDKYTYTVTVPKGTKEIYVIANCESTGCEIINDGVVPIDEETEKIELTTKTEDEEQKYELQIKYSDEKKADSNNSYLLIVIVFALCLTSLTLIVITTVKNKNKKSN